MGVNKGKKCFNSLQVYHLLGSCVEGSSSISFPFPSAMGEAIVLLEGGMVLF